VVDSQVSHVNVRLSASALSQLLSHAHSGGVGGVGGGDNEDVREGVLFGAYRDTVRQMATDESDATSSVQTHVDVEGCLALGSHCSFYGASASIDLPLLQSLVARLAGGVTVVGWFRCKAGRGLAPPSVREVAVQRNLQAVNPTRPLLFASVASVIAGSSLLLDHRFVTMSPAATLLVVQPLPVTVVNLQQSSADAFAAVVDEPPVGAPAPATSAVAMLSLSPNVQRLQTAALQELKARVDRVQELSAQLHAKRK
jgi:hypothetical protein